MRRSNREFGFALAALAIITLVGGCGGISVWEFRHEGTARALRSLLGEEPRGQLEGPSEVAVELITPATTSTRLAQAEARFAQARRAEVISRSDAPRLYFESMALATEVLSESAGPSVAVASNPHVREAQSLYNRALNKFLRQTGRHKFKPDKSWIAELGDRGVRVGLAHGEELWSPEYFDEVRFASDYVILGVDSYHGSDGLGVPLIAIRKPSKDQIARRQGVDRFYPYFEVYPVTAVMRFEKASNGIAISGILELYDALRVDQLAFGGKSMPLAADLTTPTAYHFGRGRLSRYERVSLFTPQKITVEAGLHMPHPYERGKIPVVMIHGLGSSAKAWAKVVNELRGDRGLRARYQFWIYMYPTGNPFALSAAEFRRSLLEARQAVDPSGTDAAYDQMVLIGHSMGGLISRLAITDSSDALWRLNSDRPIETLMGDPKDVDLLTRVFYFRAVPFVKRVVFIATPHRGSELGNNLIGRIGDALIKLPTLLENSHDALIAQNPPDFFKSNFREGVPSSIDELERNHPYLTVLDRLPPASWVKAHSIIAQVNDGPREIGTDGVVSYASSHVDWAISEKIVPKNHLCQDHPETVAELRRILLLHLEEIGANGTFAAEEETPPRHSETRP